MQEKKPSMEEVESFNIALAGLLGIALVLIIILSSRRQNVSEKRKKPPPEAGQAWPLIGHLHIMARSKAPHKTLGAMADRFGPIFTIRLGTLRVSVISDSKLARECFTTNDAAISSRPKSVSLDHLSFNYAMFGFAPYGPYWRELRKIAALELLSNKRIALLKHVLISETRSFIRELYKSYYEQKGSAEPVKLEMKEWFGNLTLSIMLQVVVGKKCFGSQAENDTADAIMCRKSIKEFFRLLGLFLVADAFPSLRWLDIGGHEKKMKATAKELDIIASKWLEEHKKTKIVDDGAKLDFMAVMQAALEDTHVVGSFDPDTINKSACLAMIAGGNDTSTVTLVWAVCLLLNNPETLRKVQEEIDCHVGKERPVDESDIGSLVYLKAVVKEVMRLYPAGPLATYRELREDCTIGGYHVAKGTHLMFNVWKIQNDPNIWPEPFEFRPERFLTTHKDIDVRGNHYELLPFGSGRRVCADVNFGLQILHLVLGTFLQAFDVRNGADGPVDMTESSGSTAVKATPLEVLITPRLPLELYE